MLQRKTRIKEARIICMNAARDFTDLVCFELSITDLAFSDLLESIHLERSAKRGGERRLLFDQELTD
jgi:hypothetical protein